jgi:hypothetical protein
MAIYLFDLAWRVLVELGTARTGVATGGTTTTIIDTNGLKLIDDDYYNGGTAFILKDAGGESAAPENEFSKISNFANETATIALQDALTVSPAVGDTYGVANQRFPLFRIIQRINSALFMDGYIPGEDKTTITTAANQREYDLPAEASRDLREVFWLSNTDSDRTEPIPVVNWGIQKTAIGTADKLVLDYDLPSGYKLWIRYARQHPELRDASDELDQAIHPDRIVYGASAELLREYRDRTRLRNLGDTIEYLGLKAQRAKEMHPLPTLPSRQAKILRVSRTLEIGSRFYTREG